MPKNSESAKKRAGNTLTYILFALVRNDCTLHTDTQKGENAANKRTSCKAYQHNCHRSSEYVVYSESARKRVLLLTIAVIDQRFLAPHGALTLLVSSLKATRKKTKREEKRKSIERALTLAWVVGRRGYLRATFTAGDLHCK